MPIKAANLRVDCLKILVPGGTEIEKQEGNTFHGVTLYRYLHNPFI